jgi:hypothetical protein
MKTIRRLAILIAVTSAVCVVVWTAVLTFAPDPIRGRRRDSWAKPQWPGAPERIAFNLLIVGAVAVAGRKVLRLKL